MERRTSIPLRFIPDFRSIRAFHSIPGLILFLFGSNPVVRIWQRKKCLLLNEDSSRMKGTTERAPQLCYDALHLRSTSVTMSNISPAPQTRLAEVGIVRETCLGICLSH